MNHGERFRQQLSGIERVRETIRRDRGERAPSGPVTLCGTPDGTEVRAEPVQRWRTCVHQFRLRAKFWFRGPRQCTWCGVFEQRPEDGADCQCRACLY